MRVEVLVWIKDKIRGRYLGRHMDHLADSIAKLSQGRENGCFTLCLFIILLVQSGLLSGHLLGNSCPLG